MDFGLSQEQREVQELARKILGEQVSAASLAAYDEYQQVRFDAGLWQQLLSAGLPAVAVSQQYGGMGFGFAELALFLEELGRAIAPVPALMHSVAAVMPIERFGSAALKEAMLPGAVSGEM